MTFAVPRCPNPDCKLHHTPSTKLIIRWGFFQARCRERREQRYRCKQCRKTFSRQTFRHDYRDRRPDRNARLFELLTSGVGLRQSARVLKMGPTSVQKKMVKLARTCAGLHENLCSQLPADGTYLMDEEESYETESIRPLTIPMLIEQRTWFLVATAVGSIRRLASPGTKRRARQDNYERAHGRRPDQSRATVNSVLESLRSRAPGRIHLLTDQKSSYSTLGREVFGTDITHVTTPGSDPRTTRNPLFPINVTIAMSRDNNGRLRRKSWLVSKLAERLRCQLSIFQVFRNYTRRRFNYDEEHETPGSLLGLLPRQLHVAEVVGWRQDWGPQSVHPMSARAERTVSQGAPM